MNQVHHLDNETYSFQLGPYTLSLSTPSVGNQVHCLQLQLSTPDQPWLDQSRLDRTGSSPHSARAARGPLESWVGVSVP